MRVKNKLNNEFIYKHKLGNSTKDLFFYSLTNEEEMVKQKLSNFAKQNFSFICLNDDIDYSLPSSQNVNQIVLSFYDSLFPIPSSFSEHR